MHYHWDFSIIWEYRQALLGGLLVSLLLTVGAILTGTALALPVALGLVSTRPIIRLPTTLLVQVGRGVPILVSLLFAYYLLPVIVGMKPAAFYTAWGVLSLNLTAFAAEVLRGSILAVPREHIEAGMALGMSRRAVWRRVVLPEMIRRSLPGLIALYLSLFKYSTLASVISVPELLRSADLVVVEKFKPLEMYAAVAGLYLIVVVPLSYALRQLERHPWFGLGREEVV